MVKRGLGKGLGALLPTDAMLPPAEAEGGVLQIEVAAIDANREQPRQDFDEEKLRELTDSIREHGILQPLVLRESGHGRYELIMGERRLRAAKAAGLQKVPAILREAADEAMAELALIENIQREDLSPLEEAAALQTMLREHGHNQESLAKAIGKSRSYVANSLRLLTLEEKETMALAAGDITPGHARALLAVKYPEHRVYLLSEIERHHLSVRQAEDLARKLNEQPLESKKTIRKPPPKTPFIRQMEDKMRSHFGTKVAIHQTGRGGRIEIDYYSEEDLNRILSLVVEEEKNLSD